MVNIIDLFLSLDYFWIIFIISLVISVLSTFVYKWVTDQNKLKRIKKEVKELQADMKKHKGDQKKLMKIQQEMMQRNGEMMKQSFKPMLFTMIPLLIFFGWMSATLAYQPLLPNEQFTVTAFIADEYSANISDIKLTATPELNIQKDNDYVADKGKQVRWLLKGEEGTYTLLFEGDTFKQTKTILITTKKKYEAPIATFKNSQLEKAIIGNKSVKPILGINWLWTYILLSLIFSMGLKKILDVA